MELAKKVLRLPALRIRGGEMGEKARLRSWHLEGHGLRIGDDDFHPLTGDKRIILWLGENLWIHHKMVVPEFHILSSKWMAV